MTPEQLDVLIDHVRGWYEKATRLAVQAYETDDFLIANFWFGQKVAFDIVQYKLCFLKTANLVSFEEDDDGEE